MKQRGANYCDYFSYLRPVPAGDPDGLPYEQSGQGGTTKSYMGDWYRCPDSVPVYLESK